MWLFADSTASNGVSRGIAYCENGNDKRIFYTAGENLLALNAMEGTLIPTFGDHGKVNLHTGLPDSAKYKEIKSNTPGTIYNYLIIMQVRVSEDAGAAPAISGRLMCVPEN